MTFRQGTMAFLAVRLRCIFLPEPDRAGNNADHRPPGIGGKFDFTVRFRRFRDAPPPNSGSRQDKPFTNGDPDVGPCTRHFRGS